MLDQLAGMHKDLDAIMSGLSGILQDREPLAILRAMTTAERLAVFARFCDICGGEKASGCPCPDNGGVSL